MVSACPLACQAQCAPKANLDFRERTTCWPPQGEDQPHCLQGTGHRISAFPTDPAELTLSTTASEAVMGVHMLQGKPQNVQLIFMDPWAISSMGPLYFSHLH